MGYYSEVALCLNKNAHDKMLEKLETQDEDTKTHVQDLLKDAQKFVFDGDTLYHWLWVKWYDYFPCVGFIEKVLGELPDDYEATEQYKFMRVGEELEDNEERGSYYENPFDAEVGRSIIFNAPSDNAITLQNSETITI